MAGEQEALQCPPNDNAKVKVKDEGRSHLTDLTAQATLKYSVKDYESAAELYSQATELQAELNGEMSPQNANLLYAYGRCLYHVAVKSSDVLGTKVAGEKPEGSKKPRTKKPSKEQAVSKLGSEEQMIAEDVVTKDDEEEDGPIKAEAEIGKDQKPYFQFTGDENWDTSEEDEDEDDQVDDDGEDAEVEDDFANAYEVLDLARVLLLKKLEDLESAAGKAVNQSQEIRQLKERLADTYDLQAEISLEGERFPTAVVDLKAALELKLALFPIESSLLAEAHYKLSLALEFSSVTRQTNEDGDVDAGKEAHVDEAMREESARAMEAAIASCKLRMQREEARSSNVGQTNGHAEKLKATKGDIEDVKKMVKEMEQRLLELRQPPVSMNDSNSRGAIDDTKALGGILASILGETPAAQRAKLEEASKGAQDLSNLVKRKKPAEGESSKATDVDSNTRVGKRKIISADVVEKAEVMKKPKISDSGNG